MAAALVVWGGAAPGAGCGAAAERVEFAMDEVRGAGTRVRSHYCFALLLNHFTPELLAD